MKALIGSWDTRPAPLLAEITALRGRIAELEHALAVARDEITLLRAEQETRELEVALAPSS